MQQDMSILIDRVIATLEMQVENPRLIVRSKHQIAICARNASRRTEIMVQRVSARNIAARGAEFRCATESTHARQWPARRNGVNVAAECNRDHRRAGRTAYGPWPDRTC